MALTVNDVRGLGNPLRTYNFELLLPSLPGGGSSDILRLHIVTTVMPGFGSESAERAHHGHVIKHAGRATFPRTFSAEYFESADLKVHSILRKWHAYQWEPETGRQRDEDEYKTTGFLQLLGNDRKMTKQFEIRGMYIEDVADVNLDGSSSEIVRIPVTFSYDDWIENT